MEVDEVNNNPENEHLKHEYEEMVVEQQQKNGGKVSKKDFETITVIGKGSYGQVILVRKIDSGKLYAMKVLKKEEIIKRN